MRVESSSAAQLTEEIFKNSNSQPFPGVSIEVFSKLSREYFN